MALSSSEFRRHFPILSREIDGHALVYLDSAATAQKPQVVLDAMQKFYTHDNGNAMRGMHPLAEQATIELSESREAVQHFLHAERSDEIVFTKNATEAINLVAQAWARTRLRKGDTIALTRLEHHSNIVPWMQVSEEKDLKLRWIDCDMDGSLPLERFDEAFAEGGIELLAITGQSNVLGTRPRLRPIIEKAHAAGALVLVDASQSAAHGDTDVRELDCDFLAFSGHKLYGPMGVGVLYAKHEILSGLAPFLGGGGMIGSVKESGFTAAELPDRFEAGTQPVADIIGLRAALQWLHTYSWEEIEEQERILIGTALEALRTVKGLRILGPNDATEASSCISFVIDGIHPHDLTEILGRQGICLRGGHHCAQPLHDFLGVHASTRLSVAPYNTVEEIALLPDALEAAIAKLRVES